MIQQLADAYSRIAHILSRTELSLYLYPNPRIKEAVNQLHVCLIHFMLAALKWYKKRRVSHAISAVLKPWALGYEQHVEAIEEQARRIEGLSSSTSQAELRVQHREIRELRKEIREYQLQVSGLIDVINQQGKQLIELALGEINNIDILREILLTLNR